MSRRRVTVRAGALSLRADLRVLGVLAVAAGATLAAFTVHVGRGEFPIAPLDVLAALAGAGDEATSFIVLELRVPRAMCAVLAGAALGIAGAIFQDLARNPLVAPDVIGVSAGASLAAVALMVLGDADGALSVPLAAFGGALATGAVLYALAWRGGVQGYRLVLVGIGVAALLDAGVLYVLARGRIFEVAEAYVWLVGSLNGRGRPAPRRRGRAQHRARQPLLGHPNTQPSPTCRVATAEKRDANALCRESLRRARE